MTANELKNFDFNSKKRWARETMESLDDSSNSNTQLHFNKNVQESKEFIYKKFYKQIVESIWSTKKKNKK